MCQICTGVFEEDKFENRNLKFNEHVWFFFCFFIDVTILMMTHMLL